MRPQNRTLGPWIHSYYASMRAASRQLRYPDQSQSSATFTPHTHTRNRKKLPARQASTFMVEHKKLPKSRMIGKAWGDPWFPHGAFVASLTLWYGLVVWMVFPLFLLPYQI